MAQLWLNYCEKAELNENDRVTRLLGLELAQRILVPSALNRKFPELKNQILNWSVAPERC